MPPIRTVSSTNRPQKTERTHEENQERAYIAASRRSDRSLEARIESARRASEIHKKRTGRALRVTEQDVVNEEMYEEEDEDLPAQIRRLQQFAHLQTNSNNFNYRLHNYMASHIGTRQALMNQAQFANAPFFSNQFAPPSMLPPQMFHQNQTVQQGMSSPPMPGYVGPGSHHRSASLSMDPASGFNQASPVSPLPGQAFDHRRMSMPTQVHPSPMGSHPQTPTTPSAAPQTVRIIKQELEDDLKPQLSHGHDSAGASGAPFSTATSLAPLTTTLPTETQQLLIAPSTIGGMSYNPNFMLGSPSDMYSYKPNMSMYTTSNQATPLDPTLPMSQLDTNVNVPNSAGYITSADDAFSYFGHDTLFGDALKSNGLTRTSSHGSGDNATPGGTDWQNFIDTSFDDALGGNASQ